MTLPATSVLLGLYHVSTLVLLGVALRMAWRSYGSDSERWKDPAFRRLVFWLAVPRLFSMLSMPLNGNESGGDGTFYHYMMHQDAPYHLFLPTGYAFLAGLVMKLLWYQLPVYTYVLLAIQHGLGILTALLLYERLREDFPAGAWSLALAWGLSSPPIFMEQMTRPECLATFLTVLCFALLLRIRTSDRASLSWFLGFSAAWATLTRSNFGVVLPIVAFFLLFQRKTDAAVRFKRTIRFIGGFALVYGGFILCVHYPGTGSFRHNWAVAVNLRTKISTDALDARDNPAYFDLVKLHYQMAEFIKARRIPRQAFGPYIGASLRNLHPPETDELRRTFDAFRQQLPIDENRLQRIRRSDFATFYPAEYAQIVSTDTNPTLGDAFLGIDRYSKIELAAYRRAIWLHPQEYLRNVAQDFLPFFGLGVESLSFRNFGVPPTRDQIVRASRDVLGFQWGYKAHYDESTSGLYWDWGNALLTRWGIFNGTFLSYLYLFSLGYAILTLLLYLGLPREYKPYYPLSAALALALVLSYLLVVIGIAMGRIRYTIPIQPFCMFLLALPIAHFDGFFKKSKTLD